MLNYKHFSIQHGLRGNCDKPKNDSFLLQICILRAFKNRALWTFGVKPPFCHLKSSEHQQLLILTAIFTEVRCAKQSSCCPARCHCPLKRCLLTDYEKKWTLFLKQHNIFKLIFLPVFLCSHSSSRFTAMWCSPFAEQLRLICSSCRIIPTHTHHKEGKKLFFLLRSFLTACSSTADTSPMVPSHSSSARWSQ